MHACSAFINESNKSLLLKLHSNYMYYIMKQNSVNDVINENLIKSV